MDLPLVSFAAVYHIGSMDAADKGARGSSLEGHGLSFAPSPEVAAAWEEVARLGGYPWWRLEKEGAQFVDAHALTKAQRQAIEEWGLTSGLIERVTVWRAHVYDSEWDEERYTTHETKEEAVLEADEEGRVKRGRSLKGTPALDAVVGQTAGLDCFDLLLVAYVERETDLSGVYWDDTFAPLYLSAPRGVILPGKMVQWRAEKIGDPALRPGLSALESPVGGELQSPEPSLGSPRL